MVESELLLCVRPPPSPHLLLQDAVKHRTGSHHHPTFVVVSIGNKGSASHLGWDAPAIPNEFVAMMRFGVLQLATTCTALFDSVQGQADLKGIVISQGPYARWVNFEVREMRIYSLRVAGIAV